MKEQIQTSFARYEKKYRLHADQQQVLLQQMRPISRRTATAVTPSAIFIMTPPIGS